MFNKIKTVCQSAFDEKMAEISERIDQLSAQDRNEEANMLKAAKNIYGIFSQLLDTAEAQRDTDEKRLALYYSYLDSISAPWKKSLEIAKERGDFKKLAIEEQKLKAFYDVCRMVDAAASEGFTVALYKKSRR
ncbi:MAG: hypothetical protein IJA35_01520 [Clostridia bacterium]|nr:hypothetical protein [Clostridia bacterium]